LGEYVRDRCWLTLEEGVHKATGLPARRFKLRRRGLIQPGFFADVTVFDPAAIGTRATYLDPARRPEGIVHVIVNGKWAVHSGTLQPVFAGRAIRLGGA
jgi:N-acyl-D-amino-acid deacylase